MEKTKPIHEICVDKTSCRHETSLNKPGKPDVDNAPASEPTGHFTKDYLRKTYEDKEAKGEKPL